MFRVLIVLVAILAGIAVQGATSVSICLGTVRSTAITLRADCAEISAAAAKSGGKGLTGPQKTRILNDISAARDTNRELWQVDQVASPSQDAVIIRIGPLLLDLTQNTEMMLDRLPGGWHALDSKDAGDYFAAHEDMAKSLASQIVEAIDKCTECTSK